jgi:hypothetical protein
MLSRPIKRRRREGVSSMGDLEQGRRTEQRAQRDRQMSDVEASLNRASELIESSKREVQRSRDLMDAQRAENARQDQEEDELGTNPST